MTNQELYQLKKESEKEAKNKKTVKKLVEKVNCAIKRPETGKTDETTVGKHEFLFGSILEKTDKTNSRLKKFNYGVKKSNNEVQKQVKLNNTDECSNPTHEPQKRKLKKLTSFFSFCAKTKNKDNPGLKRSNWGIKKSKKEHQKLVKSLRSYIKQKLKWAILLFVVYIIFLSGIVSTPILVKHLRVRGQNQTKQERSITCKTL